MHQHAHRRLRPVAGRTKTALSAVGGGELLLDVSGITGVVEYQPDECTFTARCGTRISEIERMLARDGFMLPFDPPFASRGATVGGTVAAGLSGAGRFRYGGVRDFLLGVLFVDGDGHLVRGGARVVKNAAGFSLQHALLGSLGRLGVLIELTFKVFPLPPARVTLVAEFGALDRALDALVRVRQSTFELDALDLSPPGTLLVRLGGLAAALEARANALTSFLSASSVTRLTGDDEERVWQEARDFAWLQPPPSSPSHAAPSVTATPHAATAHAATHVAGSHGMTSHADAAHAAPGGAPRASRRDGEPVLVKVSLTPSRLARLDDRLRHASDAEDIGAIPRRYSAGGEVAWLGWPGALDALDRLLRDAGLQGLVLTGEGVDDPLIGVRPDHVFVDRLRQALDPHGAFA